MNKENEFVLEKKRIFFIYIQVIRIFMNIF
jgi:hypothetical protein